MRTLPQGTAPPRCGVVHRRARAHDGAGPGSRAARAAYLSGGVGSGPCVGVLLAGGAARRFGGRPKGLARLHGARIADLALAALRGATTRQVVVANDADAPRWFPDLPVAADPVPGLGPLGGLSTALRVAAGAPIVVVAWDMPFVTTELLLELRRRGEAGAEAVVPVHGEARQAEPLCAWYAAQSLGICEALLDAGARRAAALFDALPRAETISDIDLARFGSPSRLFTSVDSLDALTALGGTFDPRGG